MRPYMGVMELGGQDGCTRYKKINHEGLEGPHLIRAAEEPHKNRAGDHDSPGHARVEKHE